MRDYATFPVLFLIMCSIALWNVASAQQYQYSRGWTPGKRSSLTFQRPVKDNVGPFPRDEYYYKPKKRLANGWNFETSEWEDLEKAAYVIDLMRERFPDEPLPSP